MARLVPNPRPTVNRGVHYYERDADHGEVVCLAAFVAEVLEEGVDLVFARTGARLGEWGAARNVPYSIAPTEGHWTWPPRV